MLPRQEAINRAAEMLAALEPHTPKLRPGLTIVDACHAQLTQSIANVLQSAEVPTVRHRTAVKQLGEAMMASEAWAYRGTGRPRLLIVPREPAHLRDLRPVVAEMRRRGFDAWWLVFREADALSLRLSGERALTASRYAVPKIGQIIRARTAIRRISAPAPTSLDPAQAERAMVTFRREAESQLSAVFVTIFAVEQALTALAPQLVVVGNPCTTEGGITTRLASQAGIKTAGIQHGEVGPVQAQWSRTCIDAFAVWGEHSREMLNQLGLGDRAVVTGAAWLDDLHIQTGQRDQILVALSGAGHSVGRAEHLADILWLQKAAEQTPDLRWKFRLHRKDEPELYGAMPKNVVVEHARQTTQTIHDELTRTKLLVTKTSTSAVDAMLHQVPVVTLGRPHGEALPPFVQAGATQHVDLEASLSEAIRDALAQPNQTIAQNATRYADRYFHARDGRARQRIADLFTRLASSSAS